MGKYRKRPNVIEAVQWFKVGDHPNVRQFDPAFRESLCDKCKTIKYAHGLVETLKGSHIVCPGDWIITGIANENYPFMILCKDKIFHATYEPMEKKP